MYSTEDYQRFFIKTRDVPITFLAPESKSPDFEYLAIESQSDTSATQCSEEEKDHMHTHLINFVKKYDVSQDDTVLHGCKSAVVQIK